MTRTRYRKTYFSKEELPETPSLSRIFYLNLAYLLSFLFFPPFFLVERRDDVITRLQACCTTISSFIRVSPLSPSRVDTILFSKK